VPRYHSTFRRRRHWTGAIGTLRDEITQLPMTLVATSGNCYMQLVLCLQRFLSVVKMHFSRFRRHLSYLSAVKRTMWRDGDIAVSVSV